TLVTCEPLPTVGIDVGLGEVRGAYDHGRGHSQTPFVVRCAVDSALHDLWQLGDDVLHLTGVHVLAARHDHVVGTAFDVEVAVGVEVADVTSVEPPVPEDGLGRLRVIQVAVGHEGGTHPQLSRPARWQVLTGDQVAHPYLHVLGRSPGRGKTFGILPAQDVVLGQKETDRATDLGHPEHLAELAVQDLHGLTQQGLGDGRGSVGQVLEGRDRDRLCTHLVHDRANQGGNEHGVGDLVPGQRVADDI